MAQYDDDKQLYRELRCPGCRALLAEEYIFAGRLRFKCRRCKEFINFNFKSSKKLLIESTEVKKLNTK